MAAPGLPVTLLAFPLSGISGPHFRAKAPWQLYLLRLAMQAAAEPLPPGRSSIAGSAEHRKAAWSYPNRRQVESWRRFSDSIKEEHPLRCSIMFNGGGEWAGDDSGADNGERDRGRPHRLRSRQHEHRSRRRLLHRYLKG